MSPSVGHLDVTRLVGTFLVGAALSACSSLGSDEVTTFEQSRDTEQAEVPTTVLLPGATAPTTTAPAPAEAVAGSEALGQLGFEVISSIPVDRRAIAGLTFYDEQLFASLSDPSGRQSIDPTTGDVRLDLTFAEPTDVGGIAIWEGVIIHITAERAVELADPGSLAMLAVLETDGAASGICAFTEEVVVSNGTAELVFRDPMSFQLVRSLTVNDPVTADGLGELACANGQLWAVTEGSSTMARIDIVTGEVIASVDLAEAAPNTPDAPAGPGTISGVAHRPTSDTFFVAGDGWDAIIEVRLATPG